MPKILNRKFHLRFAFNPYLRYLADNMGDRKCVNQLKRETQLIVSLTSYEDRFDDLELALYSILNQSILPDRIILWLSDEFKSVNDLPYSITKFIKNGLEIRFVKDIGSYTKIIYALKENPNSIIVTADDDIIYPKEWLAKLYHSYISDSKDIHVHRAHRILFDDNKKILPYEKWQKHVNEESARFDNFLTGAGGVLYPPNALSVETFREDVFMKYAPFADDIWLWIMAVISGRKIRVVKNHIKTLTCTDILGQIGFKKKRTLYSKNKKGLNDKQLHELLNFYGKNIETKLK
ncbi:hypothetical protein IKQ21_07165 [bacterium]|nr:hypothetical protein [bacterium]